MGERPPGAASAERATPHETALPLVTVVIPVRDDAGGLRRCLHRLEQQDYPADRYEVVVVDNGSRRPPRDEVDAAAHARLVHEPTPGSYAARNAGVSAARGDVIAFTDADCLPQPQWLRQGTAALLDDDTTGLVAGRIRVVPHDADSPSAVELYQMLHAFPQEKYVREQHFGATANVVTRRSVLESVGLFDASLKSGGDKEWGRRVHAAGWRLQYREDVEVLHPARTTWRDYRLKLDRVFQGEFAALAGRGEGLGDVGALTWRSVVPPARSVMRHWSDPRLPDTGARLRYAVGACLARWEGARAGHRARTAARSGR